MKFVDRIELTAGKGRDNRPHDDAEHEKLHRRMNVEFLACQRFKLLCRLAQLLTTDVAPGVCRIDPAARLLRSPGSRHARRCPFAAIRDKKCDERASIGSFLDSKLIEFVCPFVNGQ